MKEIPCIDQTKLDSSFPNAELSTREERTTTEFTIMQKTQELIQNWLKSLLKQLCLNKYLTHW